MSDHRTYWTQLINSLFAKRVTTTRPPKRTTTTRPPKRTTTTKPPVKITTTIPPFFPLIEKINSDTIVRLQNKNPLTDNFVYSLQDPYALKFTRNPSCWINGANNISCFSPAQMSGSNWTQRAGTLVTKKHIVYAKHFAINILPGGTPIIFVDNQNNVVVRKLISFATHVDKDIAIGLLNEEIPDNISIAKVLPPNYEQYLGFHKHFLVVGLDQEEKAILKICNSIFDGSFSTNDLSDRIIANLHPEFVQFASFSEGIVVGDSGNPVFVIINNELVLLGCWFANFFGPHLGSLHDQVNAIIESLSPGEGFKLTSVDLK